MVRAARMAARTSSPLIDWRGACLDWRSLATLATFVGTHSHRTAWASAARSTEWRLRMARSPTPARRMAACQRSTSATPRRAMPSLPMVSLATKRARLP